MARILFVFACVALLACVAVADVSSVSEELHSIAAADHEHAEHVSAIQAAAAAVHADELVTDAVAATTATATTTATTADAAAAGSSSNGIRRLQVMLYALLDKLIVQARETSVATVRETRAFETNFKALSRRVQTAQSQLTRMRSHMRAVLSQTMTSLQHSQTSGAQLAAHVAAYQHAQSAQTAARAAVATAQTDVRVVAAQNAAVLKLLQNLVQQLRDSPNAAAALLESAAALVQRSDAAAHLVHQAAAHAATGAHTPADMIAAMHEVAELVKREFALEEEFVRNHVVAAQTVDAAHQSAAETARLRVQHVTEDIDNLNRKLNKQFTDAMYFEDQLGLLTKLRDMLVKRLQTIVVERRTAINEITTTRINNARKIATLRRILNALAAKRAGASTSSLVAALSGLKLGVSAWKKSAWSVCSVSCGAGVQTRTITCERLGGSQAECVQPAPATTMACHRAPCKTDCVLSSWAPWSVCSVTCGGGTQERARKVLMPAANGGTCRAGDALKESKKCNEQACEF